MSYQMKDQSRFDTSPITQLSGLSFECRGALPAEGCVPASWVVDPVDVFEMTISNARIARSRVIRFLTAQPMTRLECRSRITAR